MHGGTSLRGLASPSFKTGRYSKYLPPQLQERYAEAASDPELLALRSEIALVDARITDLLGRVDTAESGEKWRLLKGLREVIREAGKQKDQEAGNRAVAEILSIIDEQAGDFEAWAEIMDLIEGRRRLVESEQKRLVSMRQIVTAEEATMLVMTTASSVRDHVFKHCDTAIARKILGGVTTDIARLLNRPAPTTIIG